MSPEWVPMVFFVVTGASRGIRSVDEPAKGNAKSTAKTTFWMGGRVV